MSDTHVDEQLTGQEADEELFRSLEQSLHKPEFRSTRHDVSALLAEDFIEFGASGGVYDKKITVDALAEEDPSDSSPTPEVSDFRARHITSDTVLVTYRSSRPASATSPGRQTLRSSIWTRIDDRWQMLFHQGTVVEPR